MHLGDLLLNLCFRLSRGGHTPQLVECIHVKGQIVQFALVDGNRRIDEMVELCKLIYIIPYFSIGGMENMGPIAVDLDALHLFGVNISPDMVPLVNHQTGLPLLNSFMGKYSPE